jgi:type VI secretion system protein ImpH
MTILDEMQKEPWRFDFFSVMRRLERINRDQPRIGDSAARREEYVTLGQDPYLDFPGFESQPCDPRWPTPKDFCEIFRIARASRRAAADHNGGKPRVVLMRDEAFPRFLDLFNHRFVQLFFRAWADARPIAQHDRPRDDRFIAYIGSLIGIGSTPHRDLDLVPDQG